MDYCTHPSPLPGFFWIAQHWPITGRCGPADVVSTEATSASPDVSPVSFWTFLTMARFWQRLIIVTRCGTTRCPEIPLWNTPVVLFMDMGRTHCRLTTILTGHSHAFSLEYHLGAILTYAFQSGPTPPITLWSSTLLGSKHSDSSQVRVNLLFLGSSRASPLSWPARKI